MTTIHGVAFHEYGKTHSKTTLVLSSIKEYVVFLGGLLVTKVYI